MLVHDTYTKDEDIFQVSPTNYQLSTVLCPNANLYIENKLPVIQQFIEARLNIVTGTDSLASNDQLNILSELGTIQNRFPSIELTTLLQWATSNGAKALQIENKFGNFEKGKQPGVVLIENCEGFKLAERSSLKRII